MNASPQIQSIGPPPTAHATRIIGLMLEHLHRDHQGARTRLKGILNPKQLGNPTGQMRVFERVKQAAGDTAIDLRIETGKRGRFTLLLASWALAGPDGLPIEDRRASSPPVFRLPRMRFLGMACGVAMLAGLSVITGEAASLAFENLIFQRTRPVAEAERDVARVQIGRDALTAAASRRAEEISRLTADVSAAQKHRTDIDKPITLQAAPASKACVGRRGSTWNCSAAVQGSVAASNAAAMKAHADELKAASEAVKAAEGRLGEVGAAPDMRASDTVVAEARIRVLHVPVDRETGLVLDPDKGRS